MAAIGQFAAVLYGTRKARVGLVDFTATAAWTRVVLSHVCTANAAVQAAPGNDPWIADLNSNDFGSHAIPLKAWRRYREVAPDR